MLYNCTPIRPLLGLAVAEAAKISFPAMLPAARNAALLLIN
jgi:hypothetical protein